MWQEIQKETHRKMDQSVDLIRKELGGVRTGRASAEVLHPITVEVYGTRMPIMELATVNTPDPQLITVQPFDPSNVKAIEKAITASDLGLNPQSEGGLIRVPVPLLTEQRRKDLAKHVKKLGEDGKVALRNLRREANDQLKKLEKDKEISQDEQKMAMDKIQQETDRHVTDIDTLVHQKEDELMTV